MKKIMLTLTMMVITVATVFAAVPSTMNIQGRLLNAGSPMTGTYPAIFAIYDASSAGNLLWTESSTLDVQSGIFTAILGNVTPVPTTVFDSGPRWLEVTIDGNTLTPRLQLATNAYAFRAQHADTANFALNAAPTGDNLWSTDGTNVWRESGKVGIGTNSPNQLLGLSGMLGIYPSAFIPPTTQGLFFYNDGLGASVYAYDYPNGHGDPLGFAGRKIGLATYANGQYLPRMSIEENGDVIINGGNLSLANGRCGFGNGGTDFVMGARTPGAARAMVDGLNTLILNYTNDFSGGVRVMSNLQVDGNLNVDGTKCRLVKDARYGDLYFHANESANALFSLEGESKLEDGTCTVELDPKWLAGVTIDEAHPMQVWITFYGPHGEYYVDRANSLNGFKVIDSNHSNASFGWKVEARQKGFEDLYLNQSATTAIR